MATVIPVFFRDHLHQIDDTNLSFVLHRTSSPQPIRLLTVPDVAPPPVTPGKDLLLRCSGSPLSMRLGPAIAVANKIRAMDGRSSGQIREQRIGRRPREGPPPMARSPRVTISDIHEVGVQCGFITPQ
ncbi:uncharacterized protein LOC120668825 [Panicum virgatum]|uniref:uncharacterized protein LOC120668825 n=1 Tax=Panicum virgatum TaxID=38727 RepID=UPI0019D55A0D|nr:uncharacterized protein LOC120668825 [Panicum virgatum]